MISNWLQQFNYKEFHLKTIDGSTYYIKNTDTLLITVDFILVKNEKGTMIFPAIQVLRIDGIK